MNEIDPVSEIRLLPDRVINQIAAGEVVQRPSSVLKELLENSVDAGASVIKVTIRDAGRTLMEVLDNGKGIRAAQATKALLRHATSKISSWEDLSQLGTYGFRGEALASIAAVSQMEISSRHREEANGFILQSEGGALNEIREIAHPVGTRIAVRSLFYNVPARRNFLKKDETEFRNIEDEFIRLALARPELSLELHHQDKLIYSLRPANLKQRIIQMLGKSIAEALVPVEEVTQLVELQGFVAKPAVCRKTRYAQFLFVNGRYFRDSYLQHAISSAMEGILPPQHFPVYILHLKVDASKMDVNVHPSKIEVKFEEEQGIYAILKAAVRRSLGQFQLVPSLDFEQERLPESWGVGLTVPSQIQPPSVLWNPGYNPFDSASGNRSALSDPTAYWNAQSILQGTTHTESLKAIQEAWSSDETWDDHGRLLAAQWAVYFSERRLYMVNIPALHGLMKMEKLLQILDGIFRPGQSGLNFHSPMWVVPHGVNYNDLCLCAAPLGLELHKQPSEHKESEKPLRADEVRVAGIPVESSWSEVSDLLEYLASCIAEGHWPERPEILGYLARRRGTTSVPALMDTGNPLQISMALRARIQENLPLIDSDGRSVMKILDPQTVFDYNLIH